VRDHAPLLFVIPLCYAAPLMLPHFLSQVLQAQAAGGQSQIMSFVMIGLMFAVVYFLLIRPANKQRREHSELLTALKKDDEIVTASGMWGKIIALDDKFATIEIADKVKIRMLRDRISGRWPTPAPAKADAKGDKADKDTKADKAKGDQADKAAEAAR
jgi:preprotein translocase subunit YajC